MTKALAQRLEMVKRQIERRGVRDRRVLSAMEAVPREAFVPERLRSRAFDDCALPIECNQTISQPFVVASMCEALDLPEDARVLEIGTGSGYAAAVLSRIAAEVFTVERYAALYESARERCGTLGYANLHFLCGDGTVGWRDHAPYDGILVSAGAPDVPQSLRDQLAIGGRLVVPVGTSQFKQVLVRVTRVDVDDYREDRLGAVRFVPLVGEEGWSPEDRERPGWIV